MGVGAELRRIGGGILPEPAAVLVIAPILGIHAQKAAGRTLALLHLVHTAVDQRLRAGVPHAGAVGACIVAHSRQQCRQRQHGQQGEHRAQGGGQVFPFFLQHGEHLSHLSHSAAIWPANFARSLLAPP